jgi:hypothetical protein
LDVHYRSKQWENTREGIRDFIELGSWGKGGIDTMKDVTKNLEDASDAVRRNDPDGVVSFSYKSDENKYQQLYKDYKVLEKFTAKVGNIVEDTIDQPFYEDIDKFVHTVRDASISNYTTKNHIGAVEVTSMPYGYGAYSEYETEKKEINIDDILSGDNYYADQIKTSFAEYKAENPDEDISEEDYRTAAVNTRAFEYESIEDDQFTKEFWINIAALVVTVAVTVVCPPAGFVLGAAYAGAEMGSAISGKDWASGRELDTSERWLRGIAAPVDILPVGKAATTFTGTARTTNKVVDLGSALNKTKLRSSLAGVTAHQTSKVKQLVEKAGQQTSSRLRNASHSVKNSTSVLKNKLGEEAIKVAQKGDAGITKVLHMFPQANLATGNGIMFASPGSFNKLEAGTTKVVDRLGAASKGTGNVHRSEIDEVIKKDYDINGNVINRSVAPKGYDSLDDFLKVVDDTTIKEFGYDSIEEFKMVVGHVEDYLNASPKNNILNKRLAGGKHVKGVEYDVIGFPIFKGDDVKFSLKLEKDYYIMKDTDQFLKCTEKLRESINKGEVPKELFTKKQLAQIEDGLPRIDGLVWHHHQVPGKMQLVLKKVHSVNHLGGNSLWGGGIR